MIDIHPNGEALARAAAVYIAQEAMQSVEERGRFAIARAGGSTPKRAYEILAESPLREKMPWGSIHIFWGDERCVAPEDERSNERMARRALLDHVPINENQVHPIRCADDPHVAAADYERVLQQAFAHATSPLDLVVLGMGDDGHTAGLFPGSPALDETLRWTAVHRKEGEEHMRITTTLPLLNLSRRALFLVSGESKAAMLRTVIEEGGGPERLPAARVAPLDGEPLWMVDRPAASRLAVCL